MDEKVLLRIFNIDEPAATLDHVVVPPHLLPAARALLLDSGCDFEAVDFPSAWTSIADIKAWLAGGA